MPRRWYLMALMTAGFAAGGLMAPLAGMGPAHAAVAPAGARLPPRPQPP